jgi:hypothetical protein
MTVFRQEEFKAEINIAGKIDKQLNYTLIYDNIAEVRPYIEKDIRAEIAAGRVKSQGIQEIKIGPANDNKNNVIEEFVADLTAILS